MYYLNLSEILQIQRDRLSMYAEIHKNSERKIKNIILEVLSDTVVVNHFPHFNTDIDFFEDLSTELNKRKIEFKLDKVLAMIIFMDALIYYFKFIDVISFESEVMINNFTQEELTKILAEVYNYFLTTPRKYTIKISLENLNLPTVHSSDEITTSSAVEDEVTTTGIASLARKMKTDPYISTTVQGYYSIYGQSYFIKGAMQKINILLFLLSAKKIISRKVNVNYVNDFGVYFYGRKHNIPAVEAIIYNDDYPSKIDNYNLPIETAKYLCELEFNNNELTLKDRAEVKDVVLLTEKIILDISGEASRVKTAIDWYINSQITEDGTMSFLQVCMGLESIFGDDDYEGGLTNLLADRCAYLIGKSIKDRKDIKNRFKEVYKVRSKIVHGVRSILTHEERNVKMDASKYLLNSIRKEIVNIEL